MEGYVKSLLCFIGLCFSLVIQGFTQTAIVIQSGTYYACERFFNLCGYRTFCDSVTVESQNVNSRDPNTNYYNLNAGPIPSTTILCFFKVQKSGERNIDLINPLNIQSYSFMKEDIIGENKLQLNIPGEYSRIIIWNLFS
jgi:hypothetical protein